MTDNDPKALAKAADDRAIASEAVVGRDETLSVPADPAPTEDTPASEQSSAHPS